MARPEFITNEDIARWSEMIDADLSPTLAESAIIKEVCYAGLWLAEQLHFLKCQEELIIRIQWTAGKLSFGRDPWEVHQQILDDYINNKLVFEEDLSDLN